MERARIKAHGRCRCIGTVPNRESTLLYRSGQFACCQPASCLLCFHVAGAHKDASCAFTSLWPTRMPERVALRLRMLRPEVSDARWQGTGAELGLALHGLRGLLPAVRAARDPHRHAPAARERHRRAGACGPAGRAGRARGGGDAGRRPARGLGAAGAARRPGGHG